MLTRSQGSWKPYSLKILTPTPKHRSVEHWLQGGFVIGIPSKLVGSLVAAGGTHGHLRSAWCGQTSSLAALSLEQVTAPCAQPFTALGWVQETQLLIRALHLLQA